MQLVYNTKYFYTAYVNTVKLPEIRIKNAWLLYENASQHLHELWGKDEHLSTYEEVDAIVHAYQKAWAPFEAQILTAMTELLDLDFRQNVIDVYIAPWFNAFSDPLVIGVTKQSDEFIDVLTHELIHRLLIDNKMSPHDSLFADEWYTLFGKNHSFNTLIHIPVHAVHEAIYLDVLKMPERLERDKQNVTNSDNTDYIQAWEYVDTHGHDIIIDQLKKSYATLAKKN
jgi:hypothetical protein